MSDKNNDDFNAGWLMCLSSLVGSQGVSTVAEELFAQIGSPSAKEVRRLKLTEYDRININKLRRSTR